MSIEKKDFGHLPSGESVSLYTLRNGRGMEVHVMDYGATITSIMIPNANGSKDNVVCGFNSVEGYFTEDYLANAPFFGSTVGRYCSTIKDAKYGETQLTANCDIHNLHGGTVGFDKRMWSIKGCASTNRNTSISLSLVSEDGDQGYPGRVEAEVTITLSEHNNLYFQYKALSDKSAPFSMTNHTYYNLSGFKEGVENHTIMVDSTVKIPLLSDGTFESVQVSVAGAADDLREAKRIGDVHDAMGDGFEHYYLYEGGIQAESRKVAEFAYEPLNRSVEVFTTEHGGLFYTGKYTSDALHRESGEKFGKYRGLCIETHRIPNGPNIAGSPDIMIEPNVEWSSETRFKFHF